MMDVVVIGIVREQELAWIPPQSVSGMIIDRLDLRDHEEEDGLTHGHTRCHVRDDCTETVEYEAFQRMIVKRSKGIGYVKAMMHRVDMSV